MTVFFALLGILAVSAMIGSVVVTARDGYRHIPARSRF